MMQGAERWECGVGGATPLQEAEREVTTKSRLRPYILRASDRFERPGGGAALDNQPALVKVDTRVCSSQAWNLSGGQPDSWTSL